MSALQGTRQRKANEDRLDPAPFVDREPPRPRGGQGTGPDEIVIENRLPKKSSARQSILLHLKRSEGGLTVDDLAGLLGITPMAVRRHLGVLESAELIHSVVEKRPKGRPAHVYSLTESADDLFPNNYSGLLNVLLQCLEETSGPEAVQSIFERWKEKLVEFAQTRLDGLPTTEKLEKLIELLEDEGFMPSFEADDGSGFLVLKQYHCPMRKVAARYEEVCHFEQQTYRELLGVEVERIQRIVDGMACCAYRIPLGPIGESDAPTSGPESTVGTSGETATTDTTGPASGAPTPGEPDSGEPDSGEPSSGEPGSGEPDTRGPDSGGGGPRPESGDAPRKDPPFEV